MDLYRFLKQDFELLSKAEWSKQGKITLSAKRPVFIQDAAGKILGMLKPDNTLDVVGVITPEQLQTGNFPRGDFPIWVVQSANKNIAGWMRSEEAYRLFYKVLREKIAALNILLAAIPCQLLAIDVNGRITHASEEFLGAKNLQRRQVIGKKLSDIWGDHPLTRIIGSTNRTKIMSAENGHLHIQSGIWEQEKMIGAVQLSIPVEAIQEYHPCNIAKYGNAETDLKAIFDNNFDVIYASDGNGITLNVSSACEKLWGAKVEELIGKSVYELENQGIYRPSITRMVLETKERVQAIQTTQTGRRLMVLGTPIKDETGKIIRVINVSRDITEKDRLELEIDNLKALLEGYRQELQQLRAQNMSDNKFVFQSQQMSTIANLALKVSQVDSTVLITGETGVGKEVLASFIHTNSNRRDMPFIKLNCGAIPANLLESELFGYEKGAFTGAGKTGKPGIFELANKGTLFLDEIGELPLALQVKLLRVLQENELRRVGGTKSVKVDIRIIAATNKNLYEEMRKGTFREDLFYRLNVVPITIPPLRERKDDILPLTLFFLKQFNGKYQKNKSVSPKVVEVFQEYEWEGNIRELQNMIERLVVLTDHDLIDVSDLPMIFRQRVTEPGITVNRIMSLKEAISMVETQLIEMARKKYDTTTKIADALGVDQSTISRKLKKTIKS